MKAVAMDTAEDSLSQNSDEQLVSLQIYVPELVVQKCMQFNRDELIWDVKNQILAALPKELKEGFNYGLFCPPVNGRAGKFLDEERPLADYPFTDNSAYVELRYKRRIYKINMEEKQLKQLHSRSNLRRLIDHIHNNQVEKITKMCSRGLDPNFHCQETGESPLTLATSLKHPAKVIMALVNGGAHLDFRTKDGATVLHKAVEKNNLEALRTLLDLGSSPNYKDSRGLTTLYYSVLYNSNPQLTEMLLHDHAFIGTADPHGWQEVHQACKYGLVQHLEHLLFYGADMNARNASGNTPLHVCAVNDQESCARVLLFRGADKNALNYANQNPHQVAIIAGNLRLAEIIKNHKPEDVVPYREAPRYNPRRRTSAANMGTTSQNHSDPRLELVISGGKPPSPCPSNHSLPHLSSSDGGIPHSVSGEEDTDESGGTLVNHSTAAVETSGAGANGSGTDSDPFDSAKSTPMMEAVCVCVEEYNPSTSGHLQLAKGDLVEILAVSGSGYLEGRRRDGEEGLFPAACIQEMTIRCADTLPPGGRLRANATRNLNANRKWKTFGEPRTVILHKGKKGFGFILRGAKATSPLMERQPTEFWPSLQYLDDVDKGGVAEMAGLKKGDFLLEINGVDVSQASHERVVAIIRQSGDLVSMTVVTVIQQSAATLPPTEKPQLINRQCATLPRKLSTKKAPLPPKRDPKTTLSVGRARARSMVAGLAEIEVLDHTLNEYDSEGRSTKSSSVESIPNKPSSSATPESTATTTPTTATTTPTSNHQTTTSARTRVSAHHVSATELEDFFARHLSGARHHGTIRNRYATLARIHKMKHHKRSKHKSKDEADYRIPKNYSSTPELTFPATSEYETVTHFKRSRSLSDLHVRHSGRHAWVGSKGSGGREHRHKSREKPLQRQHSIPEASKAAHGDRSATPEPSGPSLIKQNGSDIYAETVPVSVKSSDKSSGRASCPPPSYPPPPPPVGQVVKVDVSRGEYADLTTGRQHKSTAIMSSFRPTDSAKLYASPDNFITVGYKKEHQQKCDTTLPKHMKGSGSRSQSLPPKMPQTSTSVSGSASGGRSSAASLEADNSSGDSASTYTPFKGSHRSRDHTGDQSGLQSDRRGTLRKVKHQGKFPAAVSESASPKHYPTLSQEPDYDTSEEDDPTTAIEVKSGLVTFKAVDNEAPKEQVEDSKAKQVTEVANTNMTLRRKRLKSQASVDSAKLQAEIEESLNEEDNNVQNLKSADKPDGAPSDVVLSEETGERIFLGKENPNEAERPKKVAPVPPPKKSDESSKLKDNDSSQDREMNSKAIREAFEKQNPSSDQETTIKQPGKEPIAFKATIVLKQTEVVGKDTKETPFRIKNKELIHQHSAHELLHLKNKDETFRRDNKDVTNREKLVKSPSQGFKERLNDTLDMANQKALNIQNDNRNKIDSNSNQKVAPAVPKKPKQDEVKAQDEITETSDRIKSLQIENNNEEGNTSPIIDAASRSVKENIYNFEKRSNELTTKVNLSPRRKSDVIKITLVGSQQKGNELEKVPPAPSMKTSKSCPKTFEEDVDLDVENALTTAMLHSDAHNQVTRFSAETPTTTIASTNFNDEWRRPDVVSPVNVPQYVETGVKKPPDTPPKSTMSRRVDNYNKIQTLGRKSSERDIDFQDVESTHFTETMTLNRQSLAKSEAAKFQQYPESILQAGRDHHQTRVPVLPPNASPPTTMLPPSKNDYSQQQHNRNMPPTSTGAYLPNANMPSNLEQIHLPPNIPLEVSQKIIAEHMANMKNREAFDEPHDIHQQMQQVRPPGPMSAQARLLDHRHVKVAAPAPNRVSPPKTREDDECLKLCQRVDKSLQLIRLQVDSLRMAAASEPEVITELVPPPPEFNFAAPHHGMGPQQPPQPMHIAPPPEFSDESLARQRRAQQNMITTMDAPISRRTVPPDTANYPYPEHLYRGYHPSMQSPQDHPHHMTMHHPPHNMMPNNMTASPTKTMTLSRSGYPPHHAMPPHQQIRHESNCNTLPHPGSRMMIPPQALQQQHAMSHHRPQQPPQQQPQHPYPQQGRTTRDSPRMMGPGQIPPIPQHKEFRQKPLHQWNMKDVSDWLESLFLPEYKITFAEAGITGSKLANMDNNDLMGLGVKQAGHRLNMERSIKWYLK
ncbi:SH3 and multiple ankyrin repeat domains protein 2-like isoform X1 [Argiope bruennichi]|uniref:SH3 and multiple ankyrin repeat domains protein 2-like isoform X1 n=1 Tax=Argiope bruennichi TaxID=94029 RepID=UPI002493EAA5|nr:SH3 and multiple ankyrin repeat domains protein 2-like isoform X1 [Argiope bruennichi]